MDPLSQLDAYPAELVDFIEGLIAQYAGSEPSSLEPVGIQTLIEIVVDELIISLPDWRAQVLLGQFRRVPSHYLTRVALGQVRTDSVATDQTCGEAAMRSALKTSTILAGILSLTLVVAPLPTALAHEPDQAVPRSAQVLQPAAPIAGKACKKQGATAGTFTCKKVKGKLVWVAAVAVSLQDPLCSTSNYTSQVSSVSCSGNSITFRSNGLPGSAFTTMVGITATNQQYPRPHDYSFTFPRTPAAAAAPTVPGSGAIGVAVNGVPLFSPWTQGAILQHTLDMGELDTCGGHAGRGDDYHYHIAPKCLIDSLGAAKVETQKSPIGIANDGNPIRALGWFQPSASVESQLDTCRGMRDAAGKYFYNVQTTAKWDILNCFTNQVVNTSRDNWTNRTDSQGNPIVGAKVALTITNSSTVEASGVKCYVMQGDLRSQQVIQTDQSVKSTSGSTAIFYCDPACYAEFFEPTARFPGGSVYYELVTTRCPSGFNPQSLPLLAGYAGPSLGKKAANG